MILGLDLDLAFDLGLGIPLLQEAAPLSWSVAFVVAWLRTPWKPSRIFFLEYLRPCAP
jgi:hypothetical protein